MARHVITIEVHEQPKASRLLDYQFVAPGRCRRGLRWRGEARSGATVYRAGGSTPLVAATRAVKALLAAYYRD